MGGSIAGYKQALSRGASDPFDTAAGRLPFLFRKGASLVISFVTSWKCNNAGLAYNHVASAGISDPPPDAGRGGFIQKGVRYEQAQ